MTNEWICSPFSLGSFVPKATAWETQVPFYWGELFWFQFSLQPSLSPCFHLINCWKATPLCCNSALLPILHLVSGQSGVWAESIWGWAGLGDPRPGEEAFPEEAASRPGWGTEPPSWLSLSLEAPTHPPLPTATLTFPSLLLKVWVWLSLLASFEHIWWRPWKQLPALHLDWSVLLITCLQTPPTS